MKRPTFEPFILPEDAVVYTADLEANGLYWEATQIWSLVIRDLRTSRIIASCKYGGLGDSHIQAGLYFLNQADIVFFHNGIKYDLPLLMKLHPWWVPKFKLLDTLVLSRLIFGGDLAERDAIDKVPGAYFNSHSLEAWGWRLKYAKSSAGKDDASFWQQWSPEMQKRCEGDTEITRLLAYHCLTQNPSRESVELEHAISELMAQQERNGFKFDVEKAVALYGRLAQERTKIERELQTVFPPIWKNDGLVHWKKNRRRWLTCDYGSDRRLDKGNLSGYWTTFVGDYVRVHLEPFNPGSRQQIYSRLHEKYNWEPTQWTPSGQAKCDEEILGALEYPEAKLLARYFLIEKRIGQVAEGDAAWLKVVHPDGFIHGEINPCGAVTGRATHSNPNVSQVPGNDAEYGVECRECWTVPNGWLLLGTDARKLELVCLAHYLAPYDSGAYKQVVLTGDPHVRHQEAAGLPTRKQGKTFGYAYIYGGGDEKLGSLSPPSLDEAKEYRNDLWKEWKRLKAYLKRKRRAGTAKEISTIIKGGLLRKRFQAEIIGLEKIRKILKKVIKQGYIIAPDGRHIHIRKEHAALNSLLQSAGAIICKRWLVLLDQILQERGLIHGWYGDYAFCAWSHDEAQIAFKPEHARLIAKAARVAARLAGRYYQFRCPVSADVKIGKNWAETH